MKMLVHRSKDNMDEKIWFGVIIHHLDPEFRKMLEKGTSWHKDSTLHFGP